MDEATIESDLRRTFSAVPVRLGDASIVWRDQPALLWEFVENALDEEKREVFSGLESLPGSVAALLGERLRPILSFCWDGLGPRSWAAGLQVLEIGARGHLCFWNETDSYVAVAALEPWDDPLVLAAAVKDLLKDNGVGHGLWLFGALPTETTNHRPDLLPSEVVKQAYFDWLGEEVGTWDGFEEEYFSRLVEPDHLQRSLDAVALLSQERSGQSPRRAGESSDLPDHAKLRARGAADRERRLVRARVHAPRFPSRRLHGERRAGADHRGGAPSASRQGRRLTVGSARWR